VIRLVPGIDAGAIPPVERLAAGVTANLPLGGEGPARSRMQRWLEAGLPQYERRHDDLAGDATSRLSAALHFGCLSPLELAVRARGSDGGEAYVRQLCWRDFHGQVNAVFPDLPRQDYRPRRRQWHDDDEALAAWRAGQTGYPIIDAGMRQLAAEGFMHNRARLLTASFLTKQLGVDWREGARHFQAQLVDADVANNAGNWQWVAGTGNDTRPNRMFNPLRQAHRFDPTGDYVRRYVPELADVVGGAVHEPWSLARTPRYRAPLIEPSGPGR
jgi:deoxyribodipyrimidine photo-lyase